MSDERRDIPNIMKKMVDDAVGDSLEQDRSELLGGDVFVILMLAGLILLIPAIRILLAMLA